MDNNGGVAYALYYLEGWVAWFGFAGTSGSGEGSGTVIVGPHPIPSSCGQETRRRKRCHIKNSNQEYQVTCARA